MSTRTHIEWTDATWNPVTGCTKVSPGCKHCYAERDWARLAANKATRYYGRAFGDVRMHLDMLDLPLRWRQPRRIFVNSMSDLFHKAVTDLFIADVFAVMAATPQHTYQVLTKRPLGMMYLLSSTGRSAFRNQVEEALALHSDRELVWPLRNVWLGVSVEDQATANERIPLLLSTPAAVRWISAEPLLGPLDLTPWLAMGDPNSAWGLSNPGIDWVVAGGESGPKARPMHPDWVRSLRDQCAAAGVPCLFKQWGEWGPNWLNDDDGKKIAGSERMERMGKKAAGRLLDGVLHDAYPEVRP